MSGAAHETVRFAEGDRIVTYSGLAGHIVHDTGSTEVLVHLDDHAEANYFTRDRIALEAVAQI